MTDASATAAPAHKDGPHEARTADGDLLLLTHAVLDEAALVNAVKDPKAGAVCSFIGTTRDTFEGASCSSQSACACPLR